MRDDVFDVVMAVVKEFNLSLAEPIALERKTDAPLYGEGGVLDSLALVSFIVAVEQALQDRLGRTIPLADEKAMSQKHSPYRTVGSLCLYISELLKGVSR